VEVGIDRRVADPEPMTAMLIARVGGNLWRRMSLLQLKKEVVPPSHHFHARSSSVPDGCPRIYPFGQTGLGACVRKAPGSDVTKFRENQHDWGGEGLPVAVDARTGVEDAVAAAHATVDRVQSGSLEEESDELCIDR